MIRLSHPRTQSGTPRTETGVSRSQGWNTRWSAQWRSCSDGVELSLYRQSSSLTAARWTPLPSRVASIAAQLCWCRSQDATNLSQGPAP